MPRNLSFLFTAVAALTGCGGSSSSSGSSGSSSSANYAPPEVSQVQGGADPTTQEVRYLSLGDSLSQGVGAPDPQTGAFPALLAAKWRTSGCKVTLNNPAITNYTAADVLRDQVPRMQTFPPTFVTLQVGANDVARGVPIETYRANVKAILGAVKGSGARVVVMPQNEWFRSPKGRTYGSDLADKRAAFDQVLFEETAASGAEVVDLRLLFKQHADANLWVSDGIHPTPEAYEAWATELARVIPSPCK